MRTERIGRKIVDRETRLTSQVIGVYRTFSHLLREQRGVLDFAAASAPSMTAQDLVKCASIASFGSSSGLMAKFKERT